MPKTFTIILTFLIIGKVNSQEFQETTKGKFSGLVFGDYFYNLQRDTNIMTLKDVANGGTQDVHGLRLRRIYFTYDYKISDKLNTRFRLESDETQFTSSLKGAASSFGMFVKDAYLSWSFHSNHNITIGIQDPPTFVISESFWNNRFHEKTIMNLRGYSSRDLGITLKGKIDDAGIFNYRVMAGNGSASIPENDKYKNYYGHLEVKPVSGMSIVAYGDYKSRKKITDIYQNKSVSNNISTAALFVGYRQKDKFSFGLETFYRFTENGYDNKTDSLFADAEGLGLSVFATVNINPKNALFGRFDYYDPDTNTTSNLRNMMFFGLNHKVDDKFIISPNIVVETYEKAENTDIKNSITPRLTFFWSF